MSQCCGPSNQPSIQLPVWILPVAILSFPRRWKPAGGSSVTSNQTSSTPNKGTQATSSLAFYKSTKHTQTGWWNSHGPSRGKHLVHSLDEVRTAPPGSRVRRLAETWFPSPWSKRFPGKLSGVTHIDNWSTPSGPPFWKVDQQLYCFIISFCHFVLFCCLF